LKAVTPVLALAATLLAVTPASADATHGDDWEGTDHIHWEPKRELSFGTGDFILTGAAAGVVIGTAAMPLRSEHWRGGILIDEDVRDALRLSTLPGRYAARDASDVGVSLASTWPFLVDALLTAWWYRGRADLARNMAFVSAEAFALAAAVQGTANQVASRERPFGRLCGKDVPENSVDCAPSVRYRSFFSGHATLSFTSAALLCTNHLSLGLFGGAGDILTCVGGGTVAVMTSVFRIMSDMHYASDVAIGALVGTAAGITIPLLHMRSSQNVRIAPVGQGLGLVGTF
jgi:membrane-associated phospholipid phosphatase